MDTIAKWLPRVAYLAALVLAGLVIRNDGRSASHVDTLAQLKFLVLPGALALVAGGIGATAQFHSRAVASALRTEPPAPSDGGTTISFRSPRANLLIEIPAGGMTLDESIGVLLRALSEHSTAPKAGGP